MSLVLVVWLVFTVIPALKGLCMGVFWIWVASLVMLTIIGAVCRDIEDDRTIWDWNFKKNINNWKIAIPFLVIGVMIPNQSTTAYMTAGYATQKVIDNPAVQSLGNDGIDVLKALMKHAKDNIDQQIDSVKPKESK